MATCDHCGVERTENDFEYGPIQAIFGQPLGWYSGDDGELCGTCMGDLIYGGDA